MVATRSERSSGLDARATVQLADPKVEELAEYELARGPFEYGGTWGASGIEPLVVCGSCFCSSLGSPCWIRVTVSVKLPPPEALLRGF